MQYKLLHGNKQWHDNIQVGTSSHKKRNTDEDKDYPHPYNAFTDCCGALSQRHNTVRRQDRTPGSHGGESMPSSDQA